MWNKWLVLGEFVAAAAVLGCLALAPIADAQLDDFERRDPAAKAKSAKQVAVTGVRFTADGNIDGTLVNRSDATLRNVRLLIKYAWLWNDERNPGEDSPGRSFYHTVESDIPAFGTLGFHYAPAAPLPRRGDGRFVASVEVARFTQVRYRKVK